MEGCHHEEYRESCCAPCTYSQQALWQYTHSFGRGRFGHGGRERGLAPVNEGGLRWYLDPPGRPGEGGGRYLLRKLVFLAAYSSVYVFLHP